MMKELNGLIFIYIFVPFIFTTLNVTCLNSNRSIITKLFIKLLFLYFFEAVTLFFVNIIVLNIRVFYNINYNDHTFSYNGALFVSCIAVMEIKWIWFFSLGQIHYDSLWMQLQVKWEFGQGEFNEANQRNYIHTSRHRHVLLRCLSLKANRLS